jgi:hypothetical protein
VPAEQLPITGSTDSPIDQLARNAIADLEAFGGEAFPRFYRAEFPASTGRDAGGLLRRGLGAWVDDGEAMHVAIDERDLDSSLRGYSPGDIDEAVTFLLTYGLSDRVFPDVDASGFELQRSFWSRFRQGGGPCDLGL